MANSTTAKDCWSRLSQVVEESGLTLHSFAMAIGLSRSETLYQIRRGQIGISNKVADAVIAAYPQYNKAWLLTGFGNKYADPSQVKGHIPFYNCNLSQIINIDHIEPESYIFLPMASSADFAIIYHGEDMMPSIPSGTVLLLSKCDPRAVVYGNEYVVVTEKFVTLRRVRNQQSDTLEPRFRLEADNPERFDSVTVCVADVLAAYAVKARIILKN
jgi:hypothetical protein